MSAPTPQPITDWSEKLGLGHAQRLRARSSLSNRFRLRTARTALGVIQLTTTVTFVGLVTMSYTAERFCDCATRASISSRLASASMT
jgi:hypothetical protein